VCSVSARRGAGYLNAAFGAGGAIGALAALTLIGRRRLALPLIAAAAGWALLLVVLGAWPTAIGAVLLLAAAGTARSMLDVSGRTILVRAAPVALRGRMFGLLEGAAMMGLALGSLLVPVIAQLGGAGTALACTGAVLVTVVLVAGRRVWRLDEAAGAAIAANEPAPALAAEPGVARDAALVAY
jgi:hypothetical protein